MDAVILTCSVVLAFGLGLLCLFAWEQVISFREWLRPDHNWASPEEQKKNLRVTAIVLFFWGIIAAIFLFD